MAVAAKKPFGGNAAKVAGLRKNLYLLSFNLYSPLEKLSISVRLYQYGGKLIDNLVQELNSDHART